MRSELVTIVNSSDSEKNVKELLFYERKMENLASIEKQAWNAEWDIKGW